MAESVLSSEFPSLDSEVAPDRRSDYESDADPSLDLSRRMIGGNPDAFREYYDHFFDFMLAESKRCTGCDEQTCFDIVHDAMLKAIRSMKPIENRQKLTAWTRLLVKSVAYDWLRRESRRRRALIASFENTSTNTVQPPPSGIPHEARVLWLEDQLARMPDDLRRMFDWRFRWGWTLRRIGNRLGLKPGAVDGRLRRAIDELRARAMEQDDE
jgi:RNA polymerase sigma factor (sigma-70 family)